MKCNTMAKIDWSGKNLTDSELVDRIEKLADDVECKELFLGGSKMYQI